MNAGILVGRRLAQWSHVPADVSDDALAVIGDLLTRLVEQEAAFKEYALDPNRRKTIAVSGQHPDFFTTGTKAVVVEVGVLLTEAQDIEWRMNENSRRIVELTTQLSISATPSEFCGYIDRRESIDEAIERINSEIHDLTFDNCCLLERLGELS